MKEGSRRQSARNEEALGCLVSIEDEQGANARGREAREAREGKKRSYGVHAKR